MPDSRRTQHRLIAICMLGCLAFNYPVLALFNVHGTVFAIPVLYFYIFTAWAMLIVLMAVTIDRGS